MFDEKIALLILSNDQHQNCIVVNKNFTTHVVRHSYNTIFNISRRHGEAPSFFFFVKCPSKVKGGAALSELNKGVILHDTIAWGLILEFFSGEFNAALDHLILPLSRCYSSH